MQSHLGCPYSVRNVWIKSRQAAILQLVLCTVSVSHLACASVSIKTQILSVDEDQAVTAKAVFTDESCFTINHEEHVWSDETRRQRQQRTVFCQPVAWNSGGCLTFYWHKLSAVITLVFFEHAWEDYWKMLPDNSAVPNCSHEMHLCHCKHFSWNCQAVSF